MKVGDLVKVNPNRTIKTGPTLYTDAPLAHNVGVPGLVTDSWVAAPGHGSYIDVLFVNGDKAEFYHSKKFIMLSEA